MEILQLSSFTAKDRIEMVNRQFKEGKFNAFEKQQLLKRLKPQCMVLEHQFKQL